MKHLLIISLCSLFLLSGCHQTDMRIPNVEDSKRLVFNVINRDNFEALDADEIDFILSINESEYESATVWQDKTGKTIDEVGIFVAKNDAESDALYSKVEEYVLACKAHKKEWLESYNPTEAIKLDQGALFRQGRCIGYAFLNKDEQSALFSSLMNFCSDP